MSANHPPGPPAPPEPTPADPSALHAALEAYPWHTDPEFQAGLHAILGPAPSPADGGGSAADAQRLDDLTLHARCFYYARRCNVPVDFDAYRAWRQRQPATALAPLAPATLPPPLPESAPSSAETTPSKAAGAAGGDRANSGERVGASSRDAAAGESTLAGDANPVYPPSFAEIVDMIKTGKPIPGIKEIPDTVLTGQASEATKVKRKKPWEERLGTGEAHSVSGGGSVDGYFGRLPSGSDHESSSALFAAATDRNP